MSRRIETESDLLETVIGYATETVEGLSRDEQPVGYHLNTVWPFEQVTRV